MATFWKSHVGFAIVIFANMAPDDRHGFGAPGAPTTSKGGIISRTLVSLAQKGHRQNAVDFGVPFFQTHFNQFDKNLLKPSLESQIFPSWCKRASKN